MNSQPQQRYEFGPFRLDTAEHSLLRDGQVVPLEPRVFDLLRVLVQNDGRLLQKEELLKEVWPGTFVEEGNLNRNISILRKALGEDSAGKPYIETVPKRGYRFVASVKRIRVMALGQSKPHGLTRILKPRIPTCRGRVLKGTLDREKFLRPVAGSFWVDWRLPPSESCCTSWREGLYTMPRGRTSNRSRFFPYKICLVTQLRSFLPTE